MMAIKTFFTFTFCILFLSSLQAQQLLVLNGGSFGSATDIANLGQYNPNNQSYQSLDSIGVTAVQDLLIEDNRYAYVAASDSLIKYDLQTGQRLAAAAFNGLSTVHLELYNNQLVVGNYYGLTEGNLQFYSKDDLSYQDSIPEISKAAIDFLVIGDTAYVAQNNSGANWQDTLGYLAIVDLASGSFVRYDTLSTTGSDLGRLVNVGDTAIYSLNKVNSSINSYHIGTGTSNETASTVSFNTSAVGNSIYFNGNDWYLPFDNGIGRFDIVNNQVVAANIVDIPASAQGFAFAADTLNNNFYLSYIDYGNQANNLGYQYNTNGDSTGIFPVGSSPEVLEIWYDNAISSIINTTGTTHSEISLYPNPASHHLQLSIEGNLEQVRIYSIQGQLMKTVENQAIMVVDISDLPKGQYLLQAVDDASNHFSKLFVKY